MKQQQDTLAMRLLRLLVYRPGLAKAFESEMSLMRKSADPWTQACAAVIDFVNSSSGPVNLSVIVERFLQTEHRFLVQMAAAEIFEWDEQTAQKELEAVVAQAYAMGDGK